MSLYQNSGDWIAPDESGSRKGITREQIEEMQRSGSQMYMAERDLVRAEVEKVQFYEVQYARMDPARARELEAVKEKQLRQVSAERETVSRMIGGEERAEDITVAIRKRAAETAPYYAEMEGPSVIAPPPAGAPAPLVEGLNFRADTGIRRLLFLGVLASIAKSLSKS